jgi:PAS domain S-box-containing protein
MRNVKLLVTRYPGGPDEEAYGDFVLQPLREPDGSIYGIFCQGHEVTVEKLAADELRASREQLKAALDAAQVIFDNSHDIICSLSADGAVQHVNKHAERMFGYRPDEMIGRCVMEFIHPDDQEMTYELNLRIGSGVPVNTFINRYLHKDGTVVPVMWSAAMSESQDTIICIGRDMREHMAAEDKLRQAQKMEAVGRLTGGIAHDFNNLLTVVIGSAEALSEELAAQPELQSVARLALDAAERGAELVSRLLAFSRTQPLAPQSVNCNKFLEALLPILRRTITQEIDIRVETETDDEDLHCLADLTQLTSAMLNLCINARDAMAGGGRLTVRARREVADGLGHVVLSVEDTGEGMSSQTRARALEPFFTTKPEGQGSGLGLSMVYGFVEQSGGRLEIESERGRGTAISLYLPLSEGVETAAAPEAPVPAPMLQRHILLVEDDDLVRDQVRRQLLALGCRVTAHRNGHDALHRLGANTDVDLLMTDVVMPGGMNGRQLADHARLLMPKLRILFTSGHTDEPVLTALRMEGHAAFLAKPYRRAELARKLAEVLQDAA